MKKHWREWFSMANRISWQGMDVPESRVSDFLVQAGANCTEAMYQAFKERLLEEISLGGHKPECLADFVMGPGSSPKTADLGKIGRIAKALMGCESDAPGTQPSTTLPPQPQTADR